MHKAIKAVKKFSILLFTSLNLAKFRGKWNEGQDMYDIIKETVLCSYAIGSLSESDAKSDQIGKEVFHFIVYLPEFGQIQGEIERGGKICMI